MTQTRGLSAVHVILVILMLAVLGGVGYVGWQLQSQSAAMSRQDSTLMGLEEKMASLESRLAEKETQPAATAGDKILDIDRFRLRYPAGWRADFVAEGEVRLFTNDPADNITVVCPSFDTGAELWTIEQVPGPGRTITRGEITYEVFMSTGERVGDPTERLGVITMGNPGSSCVFWWTGNVSNSILQSIYESVQVTR